VVLPLVSISAAGIAGDCGCGPATAALSAKLSLHAHTSHCRDTFAINRGNATRVLQAASCLSLTMSECPELEWCLQCTHLSLLLILAQSLLILDAPPQDGWTPLLFAVSCFNADVIETLVAAGANPDLEDKVSRGRRLARPTARSIAHATCPIHPHSHPILRATLHSLWRISHSPLAFLSVHVALQDGYTPRTYAAGEGISAEFEAAVAKGLAMRGAVA